MTVLIVFLLLIVAGLLGYLLRQSSECPPASPPDPEAVLKAAQELHRIRTRLNVGMAQTEIRSHAARAKRDISNALDEQSR